MKNARWLVLLSAILVAGCLSAQNQAEDPIRKSNNEVFQVLVDRYYACFTRSASTMMGNADRAAIAEQAFRACETEEHALFSHMASRGWTYQSAFSIVNSHKLRLKQQLARL